MRQLADLKTMDVIYDYDIKRLRVRHYKYLCVHPTGRGEYHILIDEFEEPFRIYGSTLQNILDKNLNTYDEARLALSKDLKELVDFFEGKRD